VCLKVVEEDMLIKGFSLSVRHQNSKHHH